MNEADTHSPDEPQGGQAFGAAPSRYVVRLMRLDQLRPHEEHDHECAVRLSQAIAADGYTSKPVLVEQHSLTVLDGHHRVAALAMLGCVFVPSVLVSYDDPRVRLDGWRADLAVDRDMVLAAASRGRLLPKKTTRHRIDPDLDQVRVELARLNPDRRHEN